MDVPLTIANPVPLRGQIDKIIPPGAEICGFMVKSYTGPVVSISIFGNNQGKSEEESTEAVVIKVVGIKGFRKRDKVTYPRC